MRRIFEYSAFMIVILLLPQCVRTQPIVANHFCIDRSLVPPQWIDSAKVKLNIAYGHTSHGSQLVTGMEALLAVHGSLYDFNSNGSGGALIFHDGAVQNFAAVIVAVPWFEVPHLFSASPVNSTTHRAARRRRFAITR